ncbi:MAG: helix-turn-helix transcriptional regulator [Clostridia bacterium]|jgi:DNA-binding FadR family transcriptional regulator|nr:helix-turn-helix transcriptional regulator [Clostridia bacterium]
MTIQETANQLEKVAVRLYRMLSEEYLIDGARRVSYHELAEKLGCARSTVRYNVGKLAAAGLIVITKEGKLDLKKVEK